MDQHINSKESELQTLLADERERCDQHKQLYQTLKEEHGKLEDELNLVYQQLKDATTKNEQLQTSKNNYIRKLEEQIREKQKEIRQLYEEVKSFDPTKIRDTIIEEVTSHYETNIKKLHMEADKTREQYNSLHYNHAVLKCRFESRESEFSHTLERLKLQHLGEVEHLQNEIEKLDKEKSSPGDASAIELGSAKHDILQLNSQVRGLLAECQELRAQNENLTLQLNSTQRTHLKLNTDHLSNIRTLESEKQKAIMQREVLEKEISNFQEQRRIMNNDLQSSRREILSLKNKLEECEHKCHMMVTDLQVENEHLKAKHETEQQHLMAEISNLKAAVKQTVEELNRIQQVSMSEAKDLQQSLLAARQQIWKQSNEYDQERERIERKFHEYQNQKEQIISELSREVQVLQQDLRGCAESKLELEKQLVSLRERVPKDSDAANLQEVSSRKISYENEIRELKQQIDFLKANTGAFSEEKDRLLSELISRQRQMAPNYDEQKEVLQLKLNWEQQKHQFHQRLEDLESHLKDAKIASAAERQDLERKIQQYSRIVNKLKEKLDFHKTRNEELQNQREVLEKNVPFEVHQKVINKLTELQRRLEEYRLIVAAEPHFPHCNRSAAPMHDKLLTDIKNLQLRIPSIGDYVQQYEPSAWQKEKASEKTLQSKKNIYTRRRSLKTRNRDQASRISPVITSSSDLELENL